MIETLSETVILPIAGVILAIVMTLELIQIITDRNNFHEIETAVFFKWMFKSACAVLIVTNTWTIVMGVFEAAQSVVAGAAGVVIITSLSLHEQTPKTVSRLMNINITFFINPPFLKLINKGFAKNIKFLLFLH